MKFPESVPAKNFPDYEALNDGNIRNRKTGKIIKPQTDRKGFKLASLRNNTGQRKVRVARVVADSFYEGDHSKYDVCYKDGDRTNTAPDNLIFRTRSETSSRGHNKIQRENTKVRVRIMETGKAFKSIRACAEYLGSESYRFAIAECLDDENKTFNGLHFKRLSR